ISFYTFMQIAWLVSVYRGSIAPAGLFRHAIFSSAFPYILSGPIVRYEHLGPQFDLWRGPSAESLTLGFSLFSVGLAKKVLLADTLAISANAVFGAAAKSWPITGAEAWLGSLSYSFQLYFDFSGYTDMAIGLGLMLGLQLPENFISPYKSTGIVDFWRRWHITLGLWLRDFLYIPLGGNRRGRLVQYRNLFLTMLIGGAWHGAGWTFIIWGALHGFMLCVNHFYRALTKGSAFANFTNTWPVRIFSIALTFFCLNLCWVIFRADDLASAWRLYETMFTHPWQSAGAEGTLAGAFPNHYFNDALSFITLGLSALIIWALPCSHEIFKRDASGPKPWLSFTPNRPWAIGLALLVFCALLFLSRKSTFLYFQF
ncbi:MAG: MBOAT family protein, partial [Desulfovibrio sp.]|nr:MBOAT family protein [Desulfovibrio sp.]